MPRAKTFLFFFISLQEEELWNIDESSATLNDVTNMNDYKH